MTSAERKDAVAKEPTPTALVLDTFVSTSEVVPGIFVRLEPSPWNATAVTTPVLPALSPLPATTLIPVAVAIPDTPIPSDVVSSFLTPL